MEDRLLTYDAKINDEGNPTVHFSYNGNHIGTIWGVVDNDTDDFEKKHGIITILRDRKVVAIFWHTQPKEIKQKEAK